MTLNMDEFRVMDLKPSLAVTIDPFFSSTARGSGLKGVLSLFFFGCLTSTVSPVLDSKIDVLAINETKIDSSVNDNEIYLPGFEVVRKDRSVNGRSGVCIYLRSNINYQICDDLCDDQLECVVVEIIRPHSRPFIVSTWYKPPNSPQDIFRQFESLIDKVDSEQKDFYLLGDLNCNVHDGSNHNSSTLTSILDIYRLSQLISEPTRITPTSSTLIDLCITSSPEKISKAECSSSRYQRSFSGLHDS